MPIQINTRQMRLAPLTHAEVDQNFTNLKAGIEAVQSNVDQLGVNLADALIFTQAGAGAVPRPLQDKLRDTVSVREFVTGDGIADDTEGLRAFFAKTGRLIWDAGVVCKITAQVVIPHSNFELVAAKGAKVVAASSMQSMFLAKDKNNVFIYGLEFDCANLTQIGMYYRADTTNATGFEMYACKLSNSAADVTLQYGLICVDAVGGASGTFKPARIRISGTTLANGSTHGCLVAYADRVEFSGNLIDTMTNHGMEAVQCTNVAIINNTAKDTTLSGVGVGTFCRWFEIAGNWIDNGGGDGSITIEHNCVDGSVHDNIVTNARTSGINISYGTGGAAPFDKVQRITVHDNTVEAKAGVTSFAGLNLYSSTGTGQGKGVRIHNNAFTGFNGGMTAAYLRECSFTNNIVNGLTGANSFVAKLTFVQYSELAGWKCDTDTGDHAIQLIDYAGNTCNRVNIHDNYVLASGGGTKNIVQIDGAGDHIIYANGTNGALHHVNATGAATYKHGGNYGNLAGSLTAGGTANAW